MFQIRPPFFDYFQAGETGRIHQERVTVVRVLGATSAVIRLYPMILEKPTVPNPHIERVSILLVGISTAGMIEGDPADAPPGIFKVIGTASVDGHEYPLLVTAL